MSMKEILVDLFGDIGDSPEKGSIEITYIPPIQYARFVRADGVILENRRLIGEDNWNYIQFDAVNHSRTERNNIILEMAKSTANISEIARVIGMGQPTVWKIVFGARKELQSLAHERTDS